MSTTYAPPTHAHRPHVNVWLVAVIGLTAALVGLGAWALIDRYGGGTTAEENATALIDDVTAAWTAGDETTVGSLYATNAVYRGADGTGWTGRAAIAQAVPMAHASGVTVARIAPVTVSGEFATTFVKYADNTRSGTIVSVFQIRDGKILRHWDVGVLGYTSPFLNAVM